MHYSRSISRGRTIERSFQLSMTLWLAACAAGTPPSQGGSSTRDPQTASGATAALDDYADGGLVTRGAGMPIVPLHRADAGADTAVQGSHDDAGHDAGSEPQGPGIDAAAAPGAPEPDAGKSLPPGAALTQPFRRFSFSGAEADVADLAGGDDAVVHGNAALDGTGAVSFSGQGDGFVELPADLLEGVTSFTVLVWLSVSSDACWQRALDLSYALPSSAGQLQTSLFLTPYGCPDGLPTLGYEAAGAKYQLFGEAAIQQAGLVQLGASFSSRSQTLRLIVNGVVHKEQSIPVDVRTLQRAVGTLGRSNSGEPQLHGTVTELRVYASRLEPEELEQIYARGPDAL